MGTKVSVDIGTHETEYQGQKKEQNQVMITFELPEELMEFDGETKPYIINRFYTKSLHEKASLRNDLASWRGRDFTEEELKEFDLDNILGKPCQINVIHEAKKPSGVRAKITAILPAGKGAPKFVPYTKPWRYDIGEDGYNFPEQLSDRMKEIVLKSFEMQGRNDLPSPEDAAPWDNEDQVNSTEPDDSIPPF